MLTNLISGLDVTLFPAYLDPGLGSMQFQIVVAGLLSATFFVKSYVLQAKDLIGRLWKRAD
jgi:hypothetical protein